MAITLTAGSTTSNTQFTGENGVFKYSVNVQKQGTELQSVNGQIQKEDVSVGNFNQYQKSPVNISFADTLTLKEKQAILADIDDIINQVTAQ